MSALSLSPRSALLGFSRFTDALPNIIRLLEYVENWASGGVGSDNIADGAVTNTKLGPLAVTTDKTAEGVAKVATGEYVGDGTANREINLGFRAKVVKVLRFSNGQQFESQGDVATAHWAGYRASNGQWTGADTPNWQGVSANGFMCGSSAGSTSNINGETYAYQAFH